MSAKTGIKPTERLVGAVYDAAWAIPALLGRSLAGKKWREKAGCYPEGARKPHCWIHACSLGEVNVALKCMRGLHSRLPDLAYTLSVITPEGHAAAMLQADPSSTRVVYFPFDARSAMRRAFDTLRPDFVVLCEVEVWPNHLQEAARRHVPVFIINGRMTRSDERNYRRAGNFMRRIFAIPELVCARSSEEEACFSRLGARHVIVTGDMKYDGADPPSPRREAHPPVILGASTHEGEEDILLGCLQSLRASFPDLRLVIVPRHPSRAGNIIRSASRKGYRCGLSSRGQVAQDVLVVDEIGRLADWYARAAVCFVGKSLTARGGQNFLEAAAAGCPVVAGPHMENFAKAASVFLREAAVVQVTDAAELCAALDCLLRDAAERHRLRTAAANVLASQRGATARVAGLITERIAARV